ncbi:IclR family transcriptional regulator [Micromonospora sp. NBC_01813]|uniref:IclR family transcriptional regulator n=1 Tax=Micromonospora sp. NBC_01813 TaxID=2975988 RepID=UPI002DDB633C|nr:IclR family transcriptional regulator [Micromonospora sp. NBC_01813]WSA08952.1 IclR family transcriptional regulator [Micromonospora sp. NBC_01813]
MSSSGWATNWPNEELCVLPRQSQTETGAGGAGKGGDSPSATIAAVERAADVLLLFGRMPGDDLGVTEIADELGLSKAAVHRVLASLRGRGLISLDESTRRYSLGLEALRLGLRYLERIDVRHMGRPYLQELRDRTNETATLSVLAGSRQRMYVDQVTPAREVIMSVNLGEPYPLHAGASSRAFLAFLPAAQVEEYLASSKLEAVTALTVTDVQQLREELAQVRTQGWARSAAERKEGAASVAAPVFGHDGVPLAVVSVCGPMERFSDEFELCRDAVLDVAARFSERCGGHRTSDAER